MWIPGVQKNLDSMLVADKISQTTRVNDRVIYNPYNSQVAGSDGSATTAYAIADFSTSADSLTVNRRAVAAEHIDNIEELQASFALTAERNKEHSAIIAKKIDQFMLNLPVGNAGIALGDGGAVTATPWTTSNTNFDDVVNAVNQELAINNSDLGKDTFMVVSPYEFTDMMSFKQNNGFQTADNAINKGESYRGSFFSGVDIYVSNNLTNVAVLSLATNVTADDTITVAGYTWTAKATPAVAGEFDIGANVDATRVIMANMLNGSATGAESATGYFDQAAARLAYNRLQLSAVDSPSGDTLTVTCKGTFTVSETLTDNTDGWSAVKRYLIAGKYGSMFLALPGGGTTFEKKAVSLKHGRELETSQIYNGTIWTKKAPQIATILVN
jgi:hypothetical protein